MCDSDPELADVPVSSEDADGVRDAARGSDGLIAPGTDWPVRIAAATAEELHIAHPITAAVAVTCTDKVAQRRRLDAAGVPQPRWSPDAPPSYPCVVKAADRQGQRAMTIVRDPGRPRRGHRAGPARLAQRPRAVRGVRAGARGDRERVLDRGPVRARDRDRPRPLRGRARRRPPARLPGRRRRRRGGGRRGGGGGRRARDRRRPELRAAHPRRRRPPGDRGRRPARRRPRLRDLPHRRRRRPRSRRGAGGGRSAGRSGGTRAAPERRSGDRVPGRAARRARGARPGRRRCASTTAPATSTGRCRWRPTGPATCSRPAPTAPRRCGGQPRPSTPSGSRCDEPLGHHQACDRRRQPRARDDARRSRPRSWVPKRSTSVVATIRSGWLTSGPRTAELEHRFAERTGVPHAIATSSCTEALHLSLVAAGVGAGNEVVTSSFTWPATVNAILHTGATPVFADIDPETLDLDPEAARAAVTARTRALLPVHFAGGPCDMDALGSDRRRERPAGRRGRGARRRGRCARTAGRRDQRLHLLLALRDQEPGRRRGRDHHDRVRRGGRAAAAAARARHHPRPMEAGRHAHARPLRRRRARVQGQPGRPAGRRGAAQDRPPRVASTATAATWSTATTRGCARWAGSSRSGGRRTAATRTTCT